MLARKEHAVTSSPNRSLRPRRVTGTAPCKTVRQAPEFSERSAQYVRTAHDPSHNEGIKKQPWAWMAR